MISLEIHVIRQSSHVVVGLDHSGFTAQAAFHHVRINGSLHQEIHSSDLLCLFLKHADKLLADDLSLFLRLFHAGQPIVEALLRVYTDEVQIIGAVGGRIPLPPRRPHFFRSRPWSTNTQVS